jgi:hypothetical protein
MIGRERDNVVSSHGRPDGARTHRLASLDPSQVAMGDVEATGERRLSDRRITIKLRY